MKSTKFKTLGVCIATLAFLLMAVGSSSSDSSSNSSGTNGNATTTATTTKAATTKKVETVSYSTNDKSTVKDGDKGLYAYKSRGGSYSNYYIIDFDSGYVYFFAEGNDTSDGDRIKIVSGNLNDGVKIKYNDGYSSWTEYLHFKWQRQPDHLVLVDKNLYEYDYYYTNLKDALNILYKKTVTDYSDGSNNKVEKSDLPTFYTATNPVTSKTEETTTFSETESTTVQSSEDTTIETTEALPTMIDVTGMTLDKAKKQLKENGFSNIKTESDNGKIIMLESNWTVIAQSIEAGTSVDKNIEITLTCSKVDNVTTVDEATPATTTTAAETTASSETTVNNSTESKDIGFYDVSLINAQTRIEINNKIDTYLKSMLTLLTNIANNDGLEKAVVEVDDWTKINIINKFPSVPDFSARIVPLYEDKSCYAFLIETSKAKDFGNYMVKLKEQGFGSGFTSTDWIMIFDADTEAEIQLIQYVSDNNTFVFVRVGFSE